MSQRWTTRDGLNVIPLADQKVGAEDIAQNIYSRIANSNSIATLLGGEGIYSGGAVDETDLGGSGTTYPAVTLIIKDDSDNYWYKRTTTNVSISFSASTIADASLYAVLTDVSGGSNPYNDGKEISVEFVAQATAAAAPDNSLKIATGVVGTSAFSSLTGQGFAPFGNIIKSVNSNVILGSAATDTITCTGRLLVRTVNDAGPMTATGGTQSEIVFNSANSTFYGCTVTHASAATWVALG